MVKQTRDKRARIRGRITKACLTLFTFCFVFVNSQLSVLSFNYEADYDSIIVHPKKQLLRSKRIGSLMYRSGVQRFQKIKDDVFVIPLDTNNRTSNKETISQLQQSGLYDLVEPDYKFSLDQEPTDRKYVRIATHKAVIEVPGNNSEVPGNNSEAPSINSPEITNTNLSINKVQEITPNDKGFSSQYYLREINATKAWNTALGNEISVGVLDTGVDANHPDLIGKVSGGINLNDQDVKDTIGHGTSVAGIIDANTNNNQGIAGIGWNTKIISMRVTDDVGQARVSTVVTALDEAHKRGIKIVQLSLSTNQFSQTLKRAIEEAQSNGILIISTGGNTGVEEIRYPAAFDGVIGVGAVGETKELEYYSTTGDHISLVAPGSDIYTTAIDSSYDKVTGTSFAAPQVAGAAALVWSISPNLTNNEVRDILLKSADDLGQEGKDKEFGYGHLNIEKAVELAKGNDSPQSNPTTTNSIEIKSWIKR